MPVSTYLPYPGHICTALAVRARREANRLSGHGRGHWVGAASSAIHLVQAESGRRARKGNVGWPLVKSRKPEAMQQLQALAGSPDQQLDYALSQVVTATRQDLLEALLAVLGAAAPDQRVRLALLQAFADCERAPSRRDPGCHRRVALLSALRPLARREDAGLLAGAADTYEFLPPFHSPPRGDVAAALRATALAVLDEVDPTLAAYHAVRLLTDDHTSDLSGEPAVTAARTLAGQGQLLPLYGYATRTSGTMPEVTAECLRNLAGLPLSVAEPLVDRYWQSPHEIVLLGLLELLLEHPEHAVFQPRILRFLRQTTMLNLYRWLVSAALTSRDQALIAAVSALEEEERDPRKLASLREALALRLPRAPGGR